MSDDKKPQKAQKPKRQRKKAAPKSALENFVAENRNSLLSNDLPVDK